MAGLSDAEKAALKERTAELKAEAESGKRGNKAAKEEAACLAAIAEMSDDDRVIAERLHLIVTEVAPGLKPKTWYGMPAYADDGKVVCFFQAAAKFGARYATFGFNDTARLDDGALWPTAYAVTDVGPAQEKTIRSLVAKAVG